MILGRPDTIIVVARELASFYQFVKERQEAEYGSLVVLLDRRERDRRKADSDVESERRQGDRRIPAAASRAQLSVLGFSILHRQGERYNP